MRLKKLCANQNVLANKSTEARIGERC